MKILYFHQHFTTPSIGGGTRSYEFARKLIERGHRVTIVCGETSKLDLQSTDAKGIYRGVIDDIDIIQLNIPYKNSFGKFKRMTVFFKFAWSCIKITMNEDYDLMFATSTPLTIGIPGIFMKWFGRSKKPFVFEVRDLWPELLIAIGVKNSFFIGFMKILEKLCYRYSDVCIGLSPGICDGIKKIVSEKRIELIPNGSDLDIFQPGSRDDLQLDGICSTDTVAIFTGAHGIANGLDAVLDMALELKKLARDDIKIVFIGDGREKMNLLKRRDIEKLNNCLFFDPMPKIKLNKILSSVDIGLMVLKNLPAYYYGTSPNKFFDYIASGLPVVNNYPGWLSDMISDYKCGITVAPDNPFEFAKALIFLADNKEASKEMGYNARKLAESRFSRNDLSDQFVDLLEQIYSQQLLSINKVH